LRVQVSLLVVGMGLGKEGQQGIRRGKELRHVLQLWASTLHQGTELLLLLALPDVVTVVVVVVVRREEILKGSEEHGGPHLGLVVQLLPPVGRKRTCVLTPHTTNSLTYRRFSPLPLLKGLPLPRHPRGKPAASTRAVRRAAAAASTSRHGCCWLLVK
jgi:hypothetical protein